MSDTIDPKTSHKQNVEQHFKSLISLWNEFIVSADDSLRELPTDCDKWLKEVRKKKRVKCPLEGCSQSYSSVGGLKYHYKRCGIELKFVWKCKLCGYEAVKGNRLIIQHLWSDHKELLPQISPELAEIVETSLTTSSITISAADNRAKRRHRTLNITQEFHRKFYSQKSFCNFESTVSDWQRLNDKQYLDTKPSINFISTRSRSSSWTRLNLFESVSTEPHITFYAGGPIWALAWCPLPLDSDQRSDQFIAIASNMNHESSHTLSDTGHEKGLIQIWNVGPLSSRFDPSLRPRLGLAIAHSYGMVWDMEWCPGGTSFEVSPSQRTHALPRLGLLAMACGDGFVRIHSIPHPQSLDHSLNDPKESRIYSNEAVIILSPPGVGPSVRNQQTICKCLSWIQSHNQQLVAAGYGNGLIAVWDLDSKSSLVIIKQSPNQLVLKPITTWFGHSAVVNRIRWLQCSQPLLVTCSFDRSAKLWDLSDTSAPSSVFKKGLFTALDTHPQWNGMFLSHDDCYCGFQTPIYFKDFGFTNLGAVSLWCHKSCLWDISVSQWTSAIASVDAAGEAVVYPNFKFQSDPKRSNLDKIPLYHIKYVPLDQKLNPKSNKNKKSDPLVESHIKPPIRTYVEFEDKYGIQFHDFNLREEKAIPNDEVNRIRSTMHMQYQKLNDYPLLSINRIGWNPNLWSQCWLASATQSGLCRLSCLALMADKLADS